MKSVFKIFLLIILFANTVFADISPKYSNEFLAIGVGARSLSMGGAVLGSVNDITSVYWNPAGLTQQKSQIEIGAMHSEYFAGISKYDFIGASYRIDEKSVAGISMIRFGVDDIPNTLDLFDSDGNIRYDRITSFSVADYAFLFSYATNLAQEGLSIGGNIKLIRRTAGDFANAWGFGFDIAGMYTLNNWKIGANLRDATSTFNAWRFEQSLLSEVFEATGNEIPENGLELTLPRLLIGVGYLYNINESFTIYPEIALATTTDGKRNTLVKTNVISIDPTMGLEFGYNNLVFARFGVSHFQFVPDFDKTETLTWQPNIGIGLFFRGLKIDYAFTNLGDKSVGLYSHVFSLSYSFDAGDLFSRGRE